MPYKDPEKRKEVVRDSVARGRRKKDLEKFVENGVFDLQKALEDPGFQLLCYSALRDGLQGKKINSQMVRLATELTGYLTRKKEEKPQKIEFTAGDRLVVYKEFIGELEREAKDTGVCPICHKGNEILC